MIHINLQNLKNMWQVFSPDGFPIDKEETYNSLKEAEEAFENWKKIFEYQGYYSTVSNGKRQHIELSELKKTCLFKESEEFIPYIDPNNYKP